MMLRPHGCCVLRASPALWSANEKCLETGLVRSAWLMSYKWFLILTFKVFDVWPTYCMPQRLQLNIHTLTVNAVFNSMYGSGGVTGKSVVCTHMSANPALFTARPISRTFYGSPNVTLDNEIFNRLRSRKCYQHPGL